MDPEKVHEAIEKAAKHIREGKGPYFLEIKTYRYKGHSVSDPARYRSKEEVEHYKALDPIEILRDRILGSNVVTEAELDAIEEEIKDAVDAAVEFADNSPLPDPSELFTDNYMQEDYPFIKD